MKLNLLLLLALPVAIYAQDSIAVKAQKTSPYSSGAKTEKFDNKARKFKDWSISFGGGTALLQNSDLKSVYDGKVNWGWNGYISVDKQISHTFGLSLAYQMGQTNQKAYLNSAAGVATAWTKYKQIALLGDLNLSSLMRRVDNDTRYKWALHAYAGVGIQDYNTLLLDNDGSRWSTSPKRAPIVIDQKLAFDSFFFEFGTGVQYNLSKLIDIEARVMYIPTGDDSFDGGGYTSREPYNQLHSSYSDNIVTVNLGASIKLGKHPTHLRWFDPLQNAYMRMSDLQKNLRGPVVCEKGDNDNDGVCDDWDRQLDTPAGARVDGAGVALDMDLDGIIDLYDKCVTVPGPKENNGCPIEEAPIVNVAPPTPMYTPDDVTKELEGIEFELNKATIKPISYPKLDAAYDVLKTLDAKSSYAVVGCTDTRASDEYNQKLSEKRAISVINYFLDKGGKIPGLLVPEGHGSKDLKYPECNPASKCPEWKNKANRRVYFKKIK